MPTIALLVVKWLCVWGALSLLPAHAAYKRVISLAPHITELIYAIEAQDRLIATVHSSNYPAAAQQLPRVGDGVNVVAEQLLALQPDAVFAWQPTATLMALEKVLHAQGIALHYIEPQSLKDIASSALELGHWLDSETQAQALAQQWRHQLDELAATAATHPRPTPRVLIVLNSAPLYSLNDPIVNDLFAYCGVQNWLEPSSPVAPALNVEHLLARPIDAVVYSQTTPELQQLLQQLNQAQTQSPLAISVEADAFYRAGPRLIELAPDFCLQLP